MPRILRPSFATAIALAAVVTVFSGITAVSLASNSSGPGKQKIGTARDRVKPKRTPPPGSTPSPALTDTDDVTLTFTLENVPANQVAVVALNLESGERINSVFANAFGPSGSAVHTFGVQVGSFVVGAADAGLDIRVTVHLLFERGTASIEGSAVLPGSASGSVVAPSGRTVAITNGPFSIPMS
ncbi:MAG: hypothetical protein M3292_07590 [Actinomycetota bacterium]|nr:hypothetical protein [Actinomycetota bacterium]